MIKNKYALILFEIVCVGALVWGFYWVYMYNLNKGKIQRHDASTTSSSNEYVKSSTISSGISGLQVASNDVTSDLKQLSLSGNSTDKTSKSENSNSTASESTAPDPATFSQYEKYKDGKSAMFGEIQVGTGTELTANKKAAVVYKLWLTDGKLVDMSRTDEKGQAQPFIFTLGAHEVIVGWEQAMAGMKVGGSRLIIVPPAVGYGATGKDPIPANAVLVFQVQLIAVQ